MNGWDRRRVLAPMLELVAAASLGFAVGFAAWTLPASLAAGFRFGIAMVAAPLAFGTAFKLLRVTAAREKIPLPRFEPETIAPVEFMTRLQDVLAEASAAELRSDELLLEDALVEPQSDSRVVQLFRTSPLPTAGELRARIDRHLDRRGGPPPPIPDDSEELFEALESLKRSLG